MRDLHEVRFVAYRAESYAHEAWAAARSDIADDSSVLLASFDNRYDHRLDQGDEPFAPKLVLVLRVDASESVATPPRLRCDSPLIDATSPG